MIPLLGSAMMTGLDRFAIDKVGLPSAVLMETAGRGVYAALMERYGHIARVSETAVICGPGNNGGDGFVVARCLLNAGCQTTVYLLCKREAVKGDCRIHLNAFEASGGLVLESSGQVGIPESAEYSRLFVDAIFGTGLKREVSGASALWIEFIRSRCVPVVSVDIPSGISSDTGRVLGEAVKADLTVTFGHFKKGHFLQPGASFSGDLALVDIGIPALALEGVSPDLYLVEKGDFYGTFVRAPDSHKGHFGHLGVLAGGRGKMGAACLSAHAGLKVGAGLSTIAFPAGLSWGLSLSPEVMTEPLGSGSPGPTTWSPALFETAREVSGRFDGLVLGPGMGTTGEVEDFIGLILSEKERPSLVVDADALNALANRKEFASRLTVEDVLTPHPGEAARLLSTSNDKIQADRCGAARALAEKFNCVVALKGAATLVAAPDTPTRLIREGNPGLATAGSGDVLSGVIGAFLARGLPPVEAATAGVLVHAMAGDLAALEVGQEGLMAGDVLSALPKSMMELCP